MLLRFAYVNFNVVCVCFFPMIYAGDQNGVCVDLFVGAAIGNSYSSETHPTLALYGSSYVAQLAMS